MGHSVILHGRDPAKGEAAIPAIRRKTGKADLRFVQADFASLVDVRRLAEKIGRLPQLDVLINNTGGIYPAHRETQDGFEMTFGINHLAPYRLTNLLLDKLKSADPAHIVNVASGAHRRSGPLDFSDLMIRCEYAFFGAYGRRSCPIFFLPARWRAA